MSKKTTPQEGSEINETPAIESPVILKGTHDYYNLTLEKLEEVIAKHNLKTVPKRSPDDFDKVEGFEVRCSAIETSHEALKEVSDILGEEDYKVEGYDGHKFTVTFL